MKRPANLGERNRAGGDYPREGSVPGLFAEQAERTPKAVAVVCGEDALTYRELHRRAAQVARHLRSCGIGPGELVGLRVERSLEMIIGVLGILLAGGAYWALEENLPEERLRLMLAEARPKVLLVNRKSARGLNRLADPVAADVPPPLVVAIEDWLERTGEATEAPVVWPKAEDPVYVSYTSGSTGQPKGVVVPQRGVVRLVKGTDYAALTAEEVFLQLSPLSFDASTFEIWGALLNGGRLVLMPPGFPALAEIGAAIHRHGVTTLWLTAGLFHLMVDKQLAALAPLRQLLAGGDVLSPEHVRKARRALPGCRIINGYGPTENTTFTCCHTVGDECEGAASIPIGRPIANTRVYVLDAAGQPVPPGVPGELYAGGDGVACGYLRQPALTAERFVPDRFSKRPGDRLYRTGDLVRWRTDGTLEFLGRMDQQVKIRGFRVELGEIEAVLASQPEVREAMVVARETVPGEKQLVAYLVTGRQEPPDAIRLRARLVIKLPNYMVPERFVKVSALPLNRNGKVDRAALARMEGVELGLGTEYVAPENGLERTLVDIWQMVLRRERVGVEDNFFDLGGHSLLAVSICAQISSRLQFDVPLRRFFEEPTIRLLARQLTAQDRPVAASEGFPMADRTQPLPMSFGQQQMWLLHQSLPDPATYNQPIVCRLTGRVDGEKVRHALERIQERHEVLRTALRQSGADLVQVVAPAGQSTVPWQEEDLTGVPAEQQEAVWQERLREESRRPFDPAQAPWWRVLWLELAEADHVLAFIFHHSIIDEWSLRLLVQELELGYPVSGQLETATLPPRQVQYADFAVWQHRQLTASRREVLQHYWQEQLRDLPPPMELPADRPKPLEPTGGGEVYCFQITGSTMDGFRQLARQEKSTLFTIVLAAWQVWLHRYTGQTDLVVGTPVSLRDRPEVQSLLGYCLNTLPVRTRVTGSECFRDLAGQVRETLLGGFSHADLPLQKIAELAGRPGGAGQSGLFQVMFVLLEEGLPPLRLEGAVGQWVPASTQTSKNDLLLSIQAGDAAGDCQLEYATDRFTAERAASLARNLAEFMRSIAAAPETPIHQLNILPAMESEHILTAGRGPEIEYPADQCVHELFEAQVAQTPEAVAVRFENQTLTYGELNRKANQLAHHLRSRDVGPDTLVGLCVERSLDMCIGVLGILKAGAAYVPLDPSLPAQRLSYLISNAECGVVILQSSQLDRVTPCLAEIESAPLLVLLEAAAQTTRAADAANPAPLTKSHHLAYVLYTSGSTGQPKGVEMPHRPLVNLIHWQRSISAMGPGDHTLQFASLGFDVSCQEMFATWATGGTLVVVAQELRMNPAGLLAALEDWRINRMFLPFVMLEQLAEADRHRPAPLTHLKEVSVAGEQLRIGPAIRHFFERMPGSRLWNHYGPAEAHVVTSQELAGPPATWPDLPAIGRPLPNCDILLLDDRRQLVPPGVIGELYIGGVCLARGYRQRPDLTNERFVPHPFNREPEARLYRTGDLARWQGEGALEFLGRADHQVKLRGFRVELGEIEAVLGGHPEVAACVVVAEESADGGKELAAYLVAREGAVGAGGALRTWLKEKLPDYMVPARLVVVAALPLNANGKVERVALRHLAGQELAAGNDWQAPTSERERVLVKIWQELLRRERVGIHDNFFNLGGHSLLVAVMCSQIKHALGLEVPLRRVFEHPTVAGLASQMAGQPAGSVAHGEGIGRADRGQPLPMSFGQQQMWLAQQHQADAATYNLPVAWRLSGEVNRDIVRAALQVLLERHEVLRTALVADGPNLVQQVAGPQAIARPWEEVDFSHLPPAEANTAGQTRLQEEVRQPFDLGRAPLWRALWIQLAGQEQILALTFHHSIMDEWSLRRLFQELERLYLAGGQPAGAGLAELPIQYADYAVWQRGRMTDRRRAELRTFWEQQLRELPPALELPADRARPLEPTGRGDLYEFDLPGPLVKGLRELARKEQTTLFTVMLAAYQIWLWRHTGQKDLIIGTPKADRELPEVQNLPGYFLNTLAIRARLDGGQTFRETLRQTRETLLEAFSHSDLPFDQVVEWTARQREAGQPPLFQTMFVLLEEGLQPVRLGPVEGKPEPVETRTSKYDLTLSVDTAGENWRCQWEYSTDLFTPGRVAGLAAQLGELLTAITQNPEQPIRRLNLLAPEERRQMLAEGKRTGRHYPPDRCLHELFAAQAARQPAAVAVRYEQESLTYGELETRANQLAHFLREQGVGPDCLVGLCVERGLEMVTGLLAILKAGGAYVPLDPAYPPDRLGMMLEDARPVLVLTQRKLVERLPGGPAPVICLDHPGPAGWESRPATPPENRSRPGDLAYVIFTSGSTGRPKGVLITHYNVVRLMQATEPWFHFNQRDVWTLFHSYAFDFSVWEIWGALLYGGRLVVVPYFTSRSPEDFYTLLRAEGVTVLNQTPSAFLQLMQAEAATREPEKLALRYVIFGGEALILASLQPWFERHGDQEPQLVNMYGITETTVHVTYRPIRKADVTLPSVIGVSIPDLEVYLLDALGRPVAAGQTGEIYVGGAGLGRGYLNRPELTAERFVPNPFQRDTNERLYRSGDLARRHPNGELEYLGRADNQIKIRGHRIELGEIEAALSTHPLVSASVVLAQTDERQETSLSAFLVVRQEASLSISTVRTWLGGNLPEHMIPSRFETLKSLPLTANGKVDRGALATLQGAEMMTGTRQVAPRNELERLLVEIWQKILRREQVGVQDNFFTLGGHSLQAVRLAAEIEKLTGCKLPIAALFQSPTIESLASRLVDEHWTPPWSSLVPLQPRGAKPPWFFVHGVNGDVFEFLELAHLLGPDQPVYGVQAIGLADRAQRHRTIEAMAAHYVQEITACQPQGPYYLAGFCLGGLIAYEIARQLSQQGRPIALLALLDTQPNGPTPRIYRWLALATYIPERSLYHFRRWWRLPRKEQQNYFKGPWATLKSALYQSPPPPAKATTPLDEIQAHIISRGRDYRLEPYPGPVDLIESDENVLGWRPYWRHLARAGAACHRVSGRHAQILSPPYLAPLAEKLKTVLQQKQAAAGSIPPVTDPRHATPTK